MVYFDRSFVAGFGVVATTGGVTLYNYILHLPYKVLVHVLRASN